MGRVLANDGHNQESSVRARSGAGSIGLFNVAEPSRRGAAVGVQQPIWVDQGVRDLCHEARDLAALHGAAEVEVVHLVHAMTRNDAASVALYEHNIHVSSLRRETAAALLEPTPRGTTNADGSPPKSEEFQGVLIQAADLAYTRRSPVTTTDIIDTLFNMSRDTTRKILHRHRPDFDLRDTVGASQDEGRQKVRAGAGGQQIAGSTSLPTGVPTVTDTLQNTRMDAIERAIRDLTEDMARNRATFSTLVEELRDTNHNGIPDVLENPTNGHTSVWHDDDVNEISYLIGRMESNVDAKFKELARAWSVLGDRLKTLEDAVEEIDAETTTPVEMTTELEARFKSMMASLDRLDGLEQLLTSLPARLTEMEQRLQSVALNGAGDLDIERLTSKIESVEQLIRASDGDVELGPVMASLRDVEAGMRGVGGQLREVDSRTGDVNLMLEGVNERQQRMQEIADIQQGQIADLLRIVQDDLNLSISTGNGDDRDALLSSIGSTVSERFAGLSMQLQQRMGQLEDVMKTSMERPVVVNGDAGDIDTSYLNDAVAKIINNQHTLASSMDEWRAQSREDVSAIAMRMDRIENKPISATVPDDRFIEISNQLKQLQSTMPSTQELSVKVQPMDGWTRFKLWLFGTSDWYGESWGGLREDDERAWQPPQRGVDPVTPPGAAPGTVPGAAQVTEASMRVRD